MVQAKRLFGFATVIACSVVLLASQSYSAPVQGDHQLEIAGGFFHAQGADTGTLNLDLAYGHYLTPGWEVGFRQALNYAFVDDRRDAWVATTAPFINYNFRLAERIVPFVGTFLGLVWNDRDTTGTIGPNAGVKLFLTDQTYFTGRYRYEIFFDRFRGVRDNRSDGNHVVNFGLGFVWGGARPATR